MTAQHMPDRPPGRQLRGTVWAFPPPRLAAVELDGAHHSSQGSSPAPEWWHAPALARISDEFCTPGARVVLLGWPPATDREQDPEPDPEPESTPTDVAVRAHLVVLAADPHSLSGTSTSRRPTETTTGTTARSAAGPPDLYAARLVGPGGFLVVLTAADHRSGQLDDPTGALVRRARTSGLQYLQHIALLTVPLGAAALSLGALAAASTPNAEDAHRRVHRDLLVFRRPDTTTDTEKGTSCTRR